MIDDDLISAMVAHAELNPDVRKAHNHLMRMTEAALNQFRSEHDVPGVRYWEVNTDNGRVWITTLIKGPLEIHNASELTRNEFLARSRQGWEYVIDDGLDGL